MADNVLLLHTAVAIVGIVVVITWLRIPPIIALLAGTVYLGLVTGLGLEKTTAAVTKGFGDLMMEIGLLVTFGVMLGSLLTTTNALQRLTEVTLRVVGPKKVPYVFSVSLTGLFSSIYSDVLLVLTAPLARRMGARLGPNGLGIMGGALTAGIEVGLVFTVPGVAALAVAGALDVPLGQMFVFGLLVGLPTSLLTAVIYIWLMRRVLKWDPALDEIDVKFEDDDEPAAEVEGGTAQGSAAGTTVTAPVKTLPAVKYPPLALCLAPVILTLLLIALSAVSDAAGWDSGIVDFFGDPVIAMFLGATSAYAVASWSLPASQVSAAVSSALKTVGPILVLSGVSGSLAEVINQSGLDKLLGGYFSAGFLPPLLLVWLVAAILHLALGSISVAAITAAGILAPIAGSLGIPVVLIALAAGSGALFVPHVSSNFFWMFQTLLGLSTRGTFKAHSVAMTLSSLVSLPIILILSIFI
jgi:H+/gluconate symporter-like permease